MRARMRALRAWLDSVRAGVSTGIRYKVSQIKAKIISMEYYLWKAENLKKIAWSMKSRCSFSSRNGIHTGVVGNCSQCQRFTSLPEI